MTLLAIGALAPIISLLLYFPWQYDGATGIQVVRKDLDRYLDFCNETPYPGG